MIVIEWSFPAQCFGLVVLVLFGMSLETSQHVVVAVVPFDAINSLFNVTKGDNYLNSQLRWWIDDGVVGCWKCPLFESQKRGFEKMNIFILFIASIYVWFVLPFLCSRLQSWNSDQSIFWFMNKQKLPHVEIFHREQFHFGSGMGNRTISLSVSHDWGRDVNKMVSFVCVLQINTVFGYILAKSFNNEPFSPQFQC